VNISLDKFATGVASDGAANWGPFVPISKRIPFGSKLRKTHERIDMNLIVLKITQLNLT